MPKKKSKTEIQKKPTPPAKRRFLKTLVLWTFLLGVILLICGAIAGVAAFTYISKELPKITSLSDYHPSIITTVYCR